MRIRVTLAFCIVLSCAACGRDDATQYFPLDEEARWEYGLEMLMPFGNVVNGVLVTRIDGIEEIEGKDYYKLVSVSSGIPGAETDYRFLRVDVTGVYAVEGDRREFGEYLVAPANLTPGATWEVSGPKGKQSCNVERFEAAELIDQKFENCARIGCKGSFLEGDRSMEFESTGHRCPGVGLVKENTSVAVGSRKVTISQTLKEFEP